MTESTKKTQHTPGPWRIAPATAYAGTELNIDAGPGGLLGYVALVGHRGDPRAEADARLIAAAPEMLDALRKVVAYFDEHPHLLDGETWKEVWYDQARAAIARAEGR